MKFSSGLLAAFASLAMVGAPSATAADKAVHKSSLMSAAPIFNWTGFYVGGHAGGARGEIDWANFGLGTGGSSFRTNSFAGGGQIGLNFQTGALVLGIEGSLTGIRLSDDTPDLLIPAIVSYNSKVDWIATAVGRVGYSSGPGLVYLSGGYAAARLTTTAFVNIIPEIFRASATKSGWTIGGGYEHMLASNWSFGIDYKYIDLGTHDRTVLGSVTAFPVSISGIETRIHLLTARLSWKLGAP